LGSSVTYRTYKGITQGSPNAKYNITLENGIPTALSIQKSNVGIGFPQGLPGANLLYTYGDNNFMTGLSWDKGISIGYSKSSGNNSDGWEYSYHTGGIPLAAALLVLAPQTYVTRAVARLLAW